MARISDGGTGSRIRVTPPNDTGPDVPWSLATYPYPDNAFAPDEERDVATAPERLYWRSNGVLAYAPNKPHYVDEEHLLVTWDELMAPPPPPEPPKRGRGRPRKEPAAGGGV